MAEKIIDLLEKIREENDHLDTGVLGIDQCVDIICGIVENSKK